MADRDKGTDIDKLLAEVDGMLEGGTGSTTAGARKAPATRRGSSAVERADEGGGLTARMRTAAVAALVGSGAVWVLFAMLPFLRATSGAAGAFLATFVAVLLLRRR
jgi:hypothetical protein